MKDLKDKVAEIEERREELRTLIAGAINDAQESAENGELENTANGLVDLLQVISWTKPILGNSTMRPTRRLSP